MKSFREGRLLDDMLEMLAGNREYYAIVGESDQCGDKLGA